MERKNHLMLPFLCMRSSSIICHTSRYCGANELTKDGRCCTVSGEVVGEFSTIY
jgi:hypothetical protein